MIGISYGALFNEETIFKPAISVDDNIKEQPSFS